MNTSKQSCLAARQTCCTPQDDNASNTPVLFWTDYEAGHGQIGVTRSKAFESWADYCSFTLWQMGYPEFQLKVRQ